MHPMWSLNPTRLFAKAPEAADALPSMPTDSVAQVFPALAPKLKVAASIHPVAAAALASWRTGRHRSAQRRSQQERPQPQSKLLRAVGWTSAGVGAVAVGLVVGREIRTRYKFRRRTPYDFYAHSGDERDMEFGVGV